MDSKFDIIKTAKNSINNQGQSILQLTNFINEDFKNTRPMDESKAFALSRVATMLIEESCI